MSSWQQCFLLGIAIGLQVFSWFQKDEHRRLDWNQYSLFCLCIVILFLIADLAEALG